MADNTDFFTPEQVEEQVAWLRQQPSAHQGSQRYPGDRQLIEDLQRLYQSEKADARSLDQVWSRLESQGVSAPGPSQTPPHAPRQPSRPSARSRANRPPLHASALAVPARRGLSTRLLAIAAAVLLVAVVSGLVTGLVLVRQHGPVISNQPTAKPGQTAQSTQTPAPAEIAYIGSDGNVWTMTVPNGTPQQWTNQAHTGGAISYSGLTWSSDGSRLALLRSDTTPQNPSSTLLILSQDGTVLQNITLPGAPLNGTFAWSPDGKQIAYRERTGGDTNAGLMAKLFIVDPTTGATLKTINYIFEPSTCAHGSVPPLLSAIWGQHHTYAGGLDTFSWSLDQRTMFVAYDCTSSEAVQIRLSDGTATPGPPIGASNQPGGSFIVGYVTGTIELADATGKKVRTLVVNPDIPAYTGSQHYALLLGRAVWSPDGQTVYYEYDDSIWQIHVDGSDAHMIVPGTALDDQMQATVQMLGGLSSNGQMLLYLQLKGSAADGAPALAINQWYVAQADGSNPQPLPQGVSEAVWRPAK